MTRPPFVVLASAYVFKQRLFHHELGTISWNRQESPLLLQEADEFLDELEGCTKFCEGSYR